MTTNQNKRAEDLTDLELAYLTVKKIRPEVDWRPDLSPEFIKDVISHATICPIWEKEMDAVCHMKRGSRRFALTSYRDLWNWLRSIKTPQDMARALVNYWYPDGVTEEMLR